MRPNFQFYVHNHCLCVGTLQLENSTEAVERIQPGTHGKHLSTMTMDSWFLGSVTGSSNLAAFSQGVPCLCLPWAEALKGVEAFFLQGD